MPLEKASCSPWCTVDAVLAERYGIWDVAVSHRSAWDGKGELNSVNICS